MPSSRKARRAILSLIPHLEGEIYELGSGWGSLIFPLARLFPRSQVRAYEVSPIPYWVSKGFQRVIRHPNLTLVRKDFFTLDLKGAAGVVCYLYPGAMERLKEKFSRELSPGAFVVTNTFGIPGWTPERTIELDDLYCTKIFLYNID